MRTVKPCKVILRGEVRWLVRKPKSMGGERRYMASERAALDYAKSINRDAGEAGRPILSLPQPHQVALVRLVEDFDGDVPELVRSAHAGRRPEHDVTLSDLASKCVAARRSSNETEYYCEQLRRSLARFTRSCGVELARHVTIQTVRDWLDGLNVSPRTRAGYLTDLKTLFNFAVDDGLLPSNPIAKLKRPKQDWTAPPILTVANAAKLMLTARNTDPHLCPWLAVQLFGGLRKDEANRLRKSDIGEDLIRVYGKGRQLRHVTITETLGAWLAMPRQFPPKRAKSRLATVAKLAKVALPRNVLRHSFCSYAMPIHGATWTSNQAGHSEAMLLKHYRNPEVESPARFWSIRP